MKMGMRCATHGRLRAELRPEKSPPLTASSSLTSTAEFTAAVQRERNVRTNAAPTNVRLPRARLHALRESSNIVRYALSNYKCHTYLPKWLHLIECYAEESMGGMSRSMAMCTRQELRRVGRLGSIALGGLAANDFACMRTYVRFYQSPDGPDHAFVTAA